MEYVEGKAEMTSKEAIQVLQRTAWLGGETYGLQNRAEQVAEAIRMAITALEISDSISQQLDSKEFHKDIPTCDRNICFQNDANGIGCEDCEVTKAQQLNNSNGEVNNSTATQSNGIESKVKGMTACRVPEESLISRQAAIDVLHMDTSIIPYKKAREYVDATIEEIRNRLEKLPSVQPEIIHCRDCKHWYSDADSGMACEFTNMSQPEDGYCNWSERRTDER